MSFEKVGLGEDPLWSDGISDFLFEKIIGGLANGFGQQDMEERILEPYRRLGKETWEVYCAAA